MLLDKPPDDCTLEGVQYHLYVAEKIHRGIERAKKEGVLSQDDVEGKFSQWTSGKVVAGGSRRLRRIYTPG